jgi:hypothetical protein
VTVIAVIRPNGWDFPLLLHVLGAMLLVGTLILAASALYLAWRDGTASLLRLGYRSLLLGVLPAWIMMRIGAEWIASKEDLTDSNDAWVGIGFTTADGGLVFILVSILLAGLAARRAARAGRSGGLGRVTTVLVSLLLIAYLVAIWAMTTKPI